MDRDGILLALEERKTPDELRAELNANRKELKRELKSMRDSGLVETDGNHYWKGKAGQKKADQLNYAAVILVIGCILLGFYLRSYHMDYPVIGYHNWKETHYLSEARNFAREGFFKYGFFVPAWDYPSPSSDPSGAHSDTLPTISILVSIAFMLFGYELWAARLVGILLNAATIPLTYLIVRKIFKREDIAIVSAFLMAINPLLVFFSHNVQLVNVGIFCALTSLYLFMLWRDSNRNSHLILTAIFLALAGLTKYPFLAIALPMLFMFPLERLKAIGKNLIPYAISVVILLSIPVWIYYSSVVIVEQYNTNPSADTRAIQPEKVFTEQFQKITESYLADSFTMLGVYFAVLGLIAVSFSYLMERKLTLPRRCLLGSLVGIIL
ncbi:MAG: glycosyltransferase family 39 protein, partial [Candidatus Altiarchaeales archaeon]|nr:glycosyltransferase family 39 protein [Candidatus Altiarchaeota archaeon]MCG2782721.1 glycosyltransferase family 39 protein [Candidatus Altiarchaeales archaeon]